jgi:hypothetical protein
VATTWKKASAAKDALATGLLAEACRAGGLPAPQQRAVDLLTDVVQRLLHPAGPRAERADVELLKVDAAMAVAEFEHAFPPTDMVYIGAPLASGAASCYRAHLPVLRIGRSSALGCGSRLFKH